MKATPLHVSLVVFLEYFSWGLVTSAVLRATNEGLGENTLLLNGICMGIKGILAFLAVPVIGEISDLYGRKRLLLPCVFFTCIPIVALSFSYVIYFFLLMLSGAFNASFSLAFVFVSDCTSEKYRSLSYGLVSASFAASMIVSPLIGELVTLKAGESALILLSTGVTALNLFFIKYIMPESLTLCHPQQHFRWSRVLNPFKALKYTSCNQKIILICWIVFLSSTADAGHISSIVIYLRNVIGLSNHQVAVYISVCGIISVLAQTALFHSIVYYYGIDVALYISLIAQLIEMIIFGLCMSKLMMWVAGVCGAIASIAFPCANAMVSQISSPEQQGIFQGVLTGVRGLCFGVGPAIFGLAFYFYGTDLRDQPAQHTSTNSTTIFTNRKGGIFYFPGIPYLLGALLVAISIYLSSPQKTQKNFPKNVDL